MLSEDIWIFHLLQFTDDCYLLAACTALGFWRDTTPGFFSANFHSGMVERRRKPVERVLKVFIRHWQYHIVPKKNGWPCSFQHWHPRRVSCGFLSINIDYEQELWQYTPLLKSNTHSKRLWFNQHKHLGKNAVTWRPLTDCRQDRNPATLPKAFDVEPSHTLYRYRQKHANVFGMLPRFFENVLKSERLVCSAMARTKTALGTRKLW